MASRSVTRFEKIDLTREFRIWAKTHAVAPVVLHQRTGWSYPYCHGILRGKLKFGYHSFGMIVCAFGLEDLKYILDLAPEKLREIREQ